MVTLTERTLHHLPVHEVPVHPETDLARGVVPAEPVLTRTVTEREGRP